MTVDRVCRRRRGGTALVALFVSACWALAASGSAEAAEAPTNTAPPTISGTARDGSYLHSHNGKWLGTTPLTIHYQWSRCNAAGEECAEIPGATGIAHKLGHEDVGHTLVVKLTASNEAGSASASSGHSATIAPLKPSKAKAPAIAGVPEDGKTLTAGTGTWRGTPPFTYSYQWNECTRSSTGLLCTSIPGATAASYRATTSEIGKYLRATVTATNSVGSASANSSPTPKIQPGPPVSMGAPEIAGVPVDGQTLTASTGAWAGTPPFSYSYQWLSCALITGECNIIPGATGPTYTAGPLDVASGLEVVVTATGEHGSASASSAETNAVSALLPHNTELPSIVGELLDGQLLKALTGSWTGTGPLSYSYEWLLCDAAGENCKGISEAVAATLGLVSDEVGSTLRIAVTATNAAGSTTAVSAPTSIVAGLLPTVSSLPSIAGSLIDGQLLSALTGSWGGTTPLSYAYQWQRCNSKGEECKDLSGETGSALGLVSSLVGSTVRVVVTATNAAGSTSAASPASGLIGALLPGNTSLPSITGSLIDGQLLSALTGAWNGTGPLGYSYQWQQCNSKGEECKDLSGETGSVLGLVSSLVGSTVRVAVTATNAGGATTAYSPATGLIGALLPGNESLPSITGSLIDGQLLSALTGAWKGTGPISYAYQWQQCNAKGEECKNLEGETGSVLGLISGLVGDTVRVAVTATNAGGSTTAYSPASGLIGALLPSSESLPSITGSLIDGQLLSALTGSWKGTGPINYAYQWQQCNPKGEECKNLSGDTGSVLGLVSSLVGDTVRVAVTATNAGGSTTAYSPATGLIGALLPGNNSLPSITGSLIDGQALSALTGSWKGTSPLSYSYQWQQCNAKGEECKNLSGETGSVLSLVSSLVGDTVRVAVTATNAGGSTTAYSPASGLIGALLPGNTSLPSIVGSLIDGSQLSALTGGWNGTAPLSYAYQWQRCNAKGEECKDLSGDTGSVLGLVSSLVGDTVRVAVTATNGGGSTTAYSPATGLIGALLPSNESRPTITGSLVDGQLLSALTGAWKGTGPLSYSYQWKLCNGEGEACKDVSEAVASTLGLVSGDVGSTLRVAVTATNAAGSTTALSAPTSIVAALLPGNTSLPSITGSLVDGQALSALTGSWKGTTPIIYGYQWQQCNAKGEECKNLNGETGSVLNLVSALVGDTVRVAVTATNSGGSTTVYSPATGLIAALLPGNTSLPSITGSLVDGQALSALTGSWKGTTPITYGYQWQQCNAKGEECKNLNGETGSVLNLVSALVGDTVRVAVTATNSGGSTTAYSPATGVIAALLPGNTTLPSISGLAEDGQKLTGALGSWKGTTPITYGYQWQQCNAKGEECKALGGETKETLGVVSGLVKSTVRLVVTATNSAGSTQATSAPTSPVLAALPVNAVLPTISGILKLGEKLLAHPETWKGTAPFTYTYQWQLCGVLGLVGECNNIAGATKENLLLELLDVGLTLRVGVTAHNERGASETAYSKVTGLISGLGLSPTKGTAGTDVVLKGAGVGSASTVNFGTTQVEPEVKSANEVVAEAPAGSGTVPVTVSTSEGSTHETPTDQFTYSP